jgi:hypothetical protein
METDLTMEETQRYTKENTIGEYEFITRSKVLTSRFQIYLRYSERMIRNQLKSGNSQELSSTHADDTSHVFTISFIF